jgi:hypothetical protein
MLRLNSCAEFFQGEVNQKNESRRGALTDARNGRLVVRGASICLYAVREASQGDDLFIDVARFLEGKGEETKAYHHRMSRVGLQESAPQNNFRRIIAAFIPEGEFCNHTVNYCTESSCQCGFSLLLAVLNSKLTDWYFRLGSSNAHVSQYQINNLPFPYFAELNDGAPDAAEERVLGQLRRGAVDEAFETLRPTLAEAPFPSSVRAAMIAASDRIAEIEAGRRAISRAERSALDPEAQPYQDFIDRLMFALAGLSEDDATALVDRYSRML